MYGWVYYRERQRDDFCLLWLKGWFVILLKLSSIIFIKLTTYNHFTMLPRMIYFDKGRKKVWLTVIIGRPRGKSWGWGGGWCLFSLSGRAGVGFNSYLETKKNLQGFFFTKLPHPPMLEPSPRNGQPFFVDIMDNIKPPN